MIFIVGGRGRLGRSLSAHYGEAQAVCIDRSIYEHWGSPDAIPAIAAWFVEQATPGSVIYVCSGLLDPRVPGDELHRVNYVLPHNIIIALADMAVRVVTFGTAMEGTLTANPYVQSKLALSRFIEARSTSACKVTHVRIHTLYGGGEPSPFMFLGLMLNAVRQGQPFEMTQGRQLREYHHVDDEAAAIARLISAGVTGVVTLSHGRPVTLKRLAETVFDALGETKLLRLGALQEPAEENFGQVFSPPDALQAFSFREPLDGVAHYMKSLAKA
jgi:nucleoside-diphosphate-sugar epimerase